MKVLQIIDSLHAGGAERVAVNFANLLANEIEASFICVTREEGILKESINNKVNYLFLNKKSTLDIAAIRKLKKYIKSNKINIIQAHSSSFFLATLMKLLNKNVKIVWHDHYGNSEFLKDRKSMALKFCSNYFSHVFCVNKNLEAWAHQYLKAKSISYLPNFAVRPDIKAETKLNGADGKRIVCLANLRPQKDHETLLKAFSEVIKEYREWTLHLVGKDFEDDYSSSIRSMIKTHNLSNHVYLYGSKPDISNILGQCEIGILTSKSEGLPLALLEYGLANLPVIATQVGEIEKVIGSEQNGILVPPNDFKSISNAIVHLILNKEIRVQFAYNFMNQIDLNYSAEAIIKRVLVTYLSLNNISGEN